MTGGIGYLSTIFSKINKQIIKITSRCLIAIKYRKKNNVTKGLQGLPNCGVNGKNSSLTPQNVVSKVNFCKGCLLKFTFDTTFCGVEGEFLPLTPQFVVSKVNFSHQHFIFWCPSKKFSSAPNISLIGAKTVMVWGKKGIWKTLWIMEFFGIMGKRKLFQAIPCYSSLHFESHFSVPLLFFTSFLLTVVQKTPRRIFSSGVN